MTFVYPTVMLWSCRLRGVRGHVGVGYVPGDTLKLHLDDAAYKVWNARLMHEMAEHLLGGR